MSILYASNIFHMYPSTLFIYFFIFFFLLKLKGYLEVFKPKHEKNKIQENKEFYLMSVLFCVPAHFPDMVWIFWDRNKVVIIKYEPQDTRLTRDIFYPASTCDVVKTTYMAEVAQVYRYYEEFNIVLYLNLQFPIKIVLDKHKAKVYPIITVCI